QMKAWQHAAGASESLAMSVNVSGRQLTHPGFVTDVSDALEASGLRPEFVGEVARALADARLEPERLRLEITESVLLADPDAAVDVLSRLRAIGVRLDLDDFGTGYSSFRYLHRFPIDAVKIDRSFVHGVGDDPRNAAIVRTLVVLAETLGVSVVAEGVESAEEMVQLRDIRCDRGQGFFFSIPVQPHEAGRLLEAADEAARSSAAAASAPGGG
ncbi:MAG TPA: EAL domain-containing protein, partial [Longimicrobiaceae bacterium]|nr:EAL domain-containing protein [Longimicrobiaceae bacterium]